MLLNQRSFKSLAFTALILFLFSSQVSAFPVFVSGFGSNGTGAGQFQGPTGVDVNIFNNQIIISDVSNRIQIFDSTGNFISQFGSSGAGPGQFANPVGVTFNSSNSEIIISDSNNNRIQTFTSTGTYLSQFGSFGTGNGQFNNPAATAINYATGQIFVSDDANNRVQVFDSAGNYQSQFGITGTGPGEFEFPFGISVNNGFITVVDSANNRVQIFNSAQQFVSQFGSLGTGNGQFDYPNGLAQNSATGQLIVVDTGNHRIQFFDASGNFQSQFGGFRFRFNFPACASVNPRTGQIIVTDYFNFRVQILFDPTMWVLPGTSTLRRLFLNQNLTLNNGFNLIVQNTTLLTNGAMLTINPGGTFVTNNMTLDGATIADNANTTLAFPIFITKNNGTFISGSNNTFTLPGNISGSGAFIKQGSGNLILSGYNTYSGGTDINEGKLTINGTVSGPVNINPAGILSGTGVIQGNVLNNGIVLPGTPGSTLTIQGNYNSTPSGTTGIEVNPQGLSSHLLVQGTAFLDGPLSVTFDPGMYSVGTSYTFLNANTISGAYNSIPSQVGFLKLKVLYTGTTASLVISSTDSSNNLSAANKNEKAVAYYLDSLPTPPAGSDLGQILGILASLPAQELADALESISPGRLSAATVVIEDNDAVLNYINTRHLARLRRSDNEENAVVSFNALSTSKLSNKQSLATPKCFNYSYFKNQLFERNLFNSTKQGLASNLDQNFSCQFGSPNGLSAIWGHGFGHLAHQKPRKIDTGFKETTAGFVVGMDHFFSGDTILGGGFGRYRSKINLDKNSGLVHVDTNFATLYGTWYQEEFYIEGSIIAGAPKYNTKQHIYFSTVNRISQGKHHGTEVAPHIGFGYDFIFEEVNITPYIGADYIYIHEKAYSLNGAYSLSQRIHKKTSTALFTEVGIRVFRTYNYLCSLWTPEAVLNYTNKKSYKGLTTAALLGEPGSFTVNNFNGTRYQIAPGVGLLVELEKGAFVRTDLYSEFGSKYKGYEIALRAGLVF